MFQKNRNFHISIQCMNVRMNELDEAILLSYNEKKLNPIKNPFQIIIIIIMMIMVAWNLLQCKLSQTVQHITLTIVNRRLDHHHHHYYSVYSQFQSRILKSNFHSNKYWCYANIYHRETYRRIESKKHYIIWAIDRPTRPNQIEF